jgi:hypothetical protein
VNRKLLKARSYKTFSGPQYTVTQRDGVRDNAQQYRSQILSVANVAPLRSKRLVQVKRTSLTQLKSKLSRKGFVELAQDLAFSL